MSKQAINQNRFFHSSLKKRLTLVAILVGVLILLGGSLIYGPDTLTRIHYTHIYNDLQIPKNWTVKEKSLDPSGKLGSCAPYVDTTCPYLEASYSITPDQAYSKDLKSIEVNLKNAGFNTKSCVTPSQKCVNYYIEAHKGNVAVTLSVDKHDTSNAYVQIQKNN
jgi:hypothetical protein